MRDHDLLAEEVIDRLHVAVALDALGRHLPDRVDGPLGEARTRFCRPHEELVRVDRLVDDVARLRWGDAHEHERCDTPKRVLHRRSSPNSANVQPPHLLHCRKWGVIPWVGELSIGRPGDSWELRCKKYDFFDGGVLTYRKSSFSLLTQFAPPTRFPSVGPAVRL